MGINDGMPLHHDMAEVAVRATDVCTVPMSTRKQSATGRRHNERVTRWNNIVLNLTSRNAGRMIPMDLELELNAMDQTRFTTDGIHFDSIEGQA